MWTRALCVLTVALLQISLAIHRCEQAPTNYEQLSGCFNNCTVVPQHQALFFQNDIVSRAPVHGLAVLKLQTYSYDIATLRLKPPRLFAKDIALELHEPFEWQGKYLQPRSHMRSFSADPLGFALVADEAVFDEFGMYTACGSVLVRENCIVWYHPELRTAPPAESTYRSPASRYLEGTYVMAGPQGGGPAYHHIMDELSTAVQAWEILETLPDSKLVLTEPQYEQMRGYPALFGLPPNRVEYALGKERLRVKRAYYVSGGPCGLPAPGRVRAMRSIAQKAQVGTPALAADSHILVVWRHGLRAVPNWDLLVDRLRRDHPGETFRFHYPSDDARTIYQLYSGAKLIVASHGAALVNAVFARQGTRLVEIAPSQMYGSADHKRYNGCYWWMAEALGLVYFLHQTPGDQNNYWTDLNVTAVAHLASSALHWRE